MTVPVSALQEVAPGAIIELFQLELNADQHGVNETYYFHAGVGFDIASVLLAENNDSLIYEDGGQIFLENARHSDIVWNGQGYLRFPIEAEGFEWTGTGQLPRPTLRVSNLLGTITGLILSLPRGIEGAKVTRLRTLLRYLDDINFPGGTSPYSPDPTAEFPREIYYIDRKAKETRDIIEFELAAVFDLVNVRAPKRQCSNFCPWEYRSAECNYTGDAYFNENDESVATLAEDKCGKRLSSCALRFAQLVKTGTVTVGSNLLTMDEEISTGTGAPVKGFGVPAGTTVSSVSGNIVTMSANATASSSATLTGTLVNTTRKRIDVGLGNPSPLSQGIAKGMIITGTNIPPGTTVEAVSALSVTLSQPVPWNLVKTAVTSRSAVLTNDDEAYRRAKSGAPLTGFILSIENNTTGIAKGQFVIGPGLPASANAKVVNLYSNGNYWRDGTFSNVAWIELSYSGELKNSSGTYTFYTVNAQPSRTYTFTAPGRSYTFREEGILNFGGFPGIGSYYA
jgi:lambda family phage minor tail protein L